MASSQQNVELEAAKFLQKLIHDSKDEPLKLATKLYVILQHMKSSGKEHSMPYQVISRAMETVIHQNGIDIEALKSARPPLNSQNQSGDSSAQYAGPSQVGPSKDSTSLLVENDVAKTDVHASSRPPVGPNSGMHDTYQGSMSHRSGKSLDHSSPSSLDCKSANSQSQDQMANQKDCKKGNSKRKRTDSPLAEPNADTSQQYDLRSAVPHSRIGNQSNKGASSKFQDSNPGFAGSYPVMESGFLSPMQGSSSSYENHGFSLKNSNERGRDAFSSVSSVPVELSSGGLEHGDVISNVAADGSKIVQGGGPNLLDSNMYRHTASRDSGRSIVQRSTSSGMPFKEHHLKQLRAQCLVFLAFRNGLMPKKLHLEIALGNIFPKEGGKSDGFGKELSGRGIDRSGHQASSSGNIINADNMPLDATSTKLENKDTLSSDMCMTNEEAIHHMDFKRYPSPEMNSAFMSTKPDVSTIGGRGVSGLASSSLGTTHQMKSEMMNWTEAVGPNDAARGFVPASGVHSEMGSERVDNVPTQLHSIIDSSLHPNQQFNSCISNLSLRDNWKFVHGGEMDNQQAMPLRLHSVLPPQVLLGGKTIPVHDSTSIASVRLMEGSSEQLDGKSLRATLSPSKYATSDKWIVEHQKRKFQHDQKQLMKQNKTDKKIAACFHKLKETVSSSEDISAKTKSVIELKKLQLLELQRRLRSDFLKDFHKPVAADMDRLRSMKKYRHGRRIKQLEKYELKMKEERQKRIKERQKEFFTEIELHKERLEETFKLKRERWRNFNKYAKEFHRRKERIHRERIDRIQREKINLLKINDVEGYLRMVKDAKSDRVKQLLKETEKYLQKLGAKLKEAKDVSRSLESNTDENRAMCIVDDIALENVDDSDQAKHYLESNEKYYLMAHSIKESISEQPISLHGGKLREYQMNGLRWLVSLYNNHLNGILADEMGLGKTVQVIALLCYLMETKNDRGPFLVVVPSSVLPGWDSELNLWARGINKVVYSGPAEERRRLFKEVIIQQKFNVLLTTYEYLMNKHDRPKLSKVQWRYIIIDEGHRIKNASCKLNADLKHYRSSHRLLLTGTPLQNNLEELWALLNFLLPNIFNSSEDFSQWFNKPFESTGDDSPDEALLSEEENLLIINRLHQVLRPFVLRRLKHKVENELPEKIERLVRCEASAYQKILMKRVEDNLGSLGTAKGRSVHNSVMELRNICNHPYLSHLHTEEIEDYVPKHYLPSIVRLCGKLEMLDRLLPKLLATGHRILFFSTMTRLLDVMEDYLHWKQYKYLRLDGHTSGGDRGALIDRFNIPNSPYFIFLLSIRAGGVGVNLQAADTVIIFDTDWNPQVDLQAQARAHRIGQKKDVLVLRLETVNTVEEQVRASAEHKLGVANQSITAGFFDNNTSAEDRREYLESLLRECKKEEDTSVLDDDALNDLLARSESEIDVFESVDKLRRDGEMDAWRKLMSGRGTDVPPLSSRLVTDDELKPFCEAMKKYEVKSTGETSQNGIKRKGGARGLDTQHYGRGKRAREVRSYEEQWTEEEFEQLCQADNAESPNVTEDLADLKAVSDSVGSISAEFHSETLSPTQPTPPKSVPESQKVEVTPPSRRGRGRPKKTTSGSGSTLAHGSAKLGAGFPQSVTPRVAALFSSPDQVDGATPASSRSSLTCPIPASVLDSTHFGPVRSPKKTQSRVEVLCHEEKKTHIPSSVVDGADAQDLKTSVGSVVGLVNSTGLHTAAIPPIGCALPVLSGNAQQAGLSILSNYPTSMDPLAQSSVPLQAGVQNQKKTVEASRRRGIKRAAVPLSDFNALVDYEQKSDEPSPEISDDLFGPHSGNTSDPSSNGFPTTASGIDASGQNLGVVHHTQTSPHVLSVAIASQATSLAESSPLRSGRGRGRGRSQKSQRVTDGVGRRRGRRASVTLAVNVVGSASDQGIHADEHMNSESSIEQTIKQQEENSQKHAESSVDVSLESPKNNEADGLSNLQDKSAPKVIAAPHTLVDPAVGSTASTFLVDLVQNTKDVTSELFLSDEATLLDGSASSVPAGQLSDRKSDTSFPTIKLVPGNIDDQEEAPPGFDHPIHKPINQAGDKNDTVATPATEPPQAKVLVSQYVVGELNIQKDMVGELNMQQATGTDEDKSDSIKVFEVNLEVSGTTSDDVLSCRTEGNSSDKLSVSLASNLKFDSSGAMENDSTSAEEHGSVRSVITHCSITGDNVGDTLQAVVPILLPQDQADNSGLINLSADDSLSRAIDAAQDTQNSKDITAHTIILTEANQMSVEDPVIRDNVITQMVSSPDHASSVDGKSVNMACLIELYVPSEGDINEGPVLKVIEDSRSEPTVEVHSDVDELLDVGQSSGLSTIKQMSPGVENHPKTSKSASVSSDLSAVFDVDKNVIDDEKSGLEIVPEWHETELPECGGTDKTQGDEVHNLEMKPTKKEATSEGIVSNEQLPESCETVNTANTSHEVNILKMPLEDTLLPHPLEPVEVMDIKKMSDTDQLANQFTVGQPDDSQIDVATGVVTDLPDPTAESDASDNSMLRLSLVESTECNNENGLESVEGKLKATSEDPLSTESPSRAFMHGSEGDHFCADVSRNHAGVQMFAEVQNTDVSEVSNAEMQLSEVPSSSSGVDLKKDDVTGNCFIAQMPIIEMKPAEDLSLSSPNVKSSTCDVLGGSSSVRDLVGVENSNDGKVVPVEKEQLEVQASSALDAYSSKDDVPTMVAECSDCSNHDTLLDQSSVIETDALQDTVMVEGKMSRLDRGEIPCQQSHTQGMTMEGSLLIPVEIGSPSALERFEKPRTAHNYGMMIDGSSPLVGSLSALDGAEKTNSTLEERSQKPEVEGMTKEGPDEQDVILTEPTQSEMLELSPECTNETNAPQRMIIEPSVELSMSTTSIFEQTETPEITMQIEGGEHINYSGRMVTEGATAEGSIRQNGELVEQSQVKMPEVTKETIEQSRNAEVLAAEGNSIDQPELESTVMEKRSELAMVTGVVTTMEPTRVTADPAVLKLTETTRNEELEKLEVVEPVRNPALMGLQENLETIQNEKMPEATQKMERSGTPREEIIEQPRNAEVLTTEGNITDQLESEIPLMASIEQPTVTDATTTVEPSQPTGDPVVLSPMVGTETIQKEEVEQLEVVESSESVGNYGLMRLQRNPGTIQHEENDQLEERKPSESVCNELQEKPETIKQDTTEQHEATETSESVGKPFDVEMLEKPDMIEQDKIEQLEETEGKKHISMGISEGIVTVQEIGELLRPSESELPGSSELVGSPATVEPQYESEAMQVETIEEDTLKVQLTTVSAEQAKPSVAMECLEISQTTRDESNKESYVVELDPPKSSMETVESPPTVEPMQLGTIENLDEDAITAPMAEGCAAQVSQIDVIPQSVEHGGSLAALELLGGYDTDQEESIEANEAEPAIDSPFDLVAEKEAIAVSAEEKAAREPKCSDALVPKSMEDEAATVDDPLENTDLEPKAAP